MPKTERVPQYCALSWSDHAESGSLLFATVEVLFLLIVVGPSLIIGLALSVKAQSFHSQYGLGIILFQTQDAPKSLAMDATVHQEA